ncbi:MAG: hypothetical protein ACK559_32625, partial [bacterium]
RGPARRGEGGAAEPGPAVRGAEQVDVVAQPAGAQQAAGRREAHQRADGGGDAGVLPARGPGPRAARARAGVEAHPRHPDDAGDGEGAEQGVDPGHGRGLSRGRAG